MQAGGGTVNKAKIDRLLPLAYDAITKAGIAENGSVNKTFRGKASSFGAAITMGSLLAAIAFFSEKGDGDVDRSKLLRVIFLVLKQDGEISEDAESLYRWASERINAGEEIQCKEHIINAAIAIKLAMNLYKLTD